MLHFVPQPTLLLPRRRNVILGPSLLRKWFANLSDQLKVEKEKKGALLTVCWLTPLHAASWLSIVTGADTAIWATKLILTPPLKRRRRPQITQKSPF